MDTKNSCITINSFNCRGLRDIHKRQNIFKWIKSNYMGITLLQETHSTIREENKWEQEWGGTIYYSHGEHNAKGVAILIPKELTNNFSFIKGTQDNEGRFLLMNCKIEDNTITIVNIYSPTKDHVREQNVFLNNIKTIIEEYSDNNLIIGGDFNTCLNSNLDKKGGRPENQSSYTNNILSFCEEYSLIDVWRLRNPHKLSFTRRDRCKGGIVQSRLDYWLISTGLTYLVQNTTIKPGNCSDHSIISLKIHILGTTERGKGFWKFNNSLLMEKEYTNMVKNIIENIKVNVHMENKNKLWEYTKCQLRSDTIIYASKRAKEIRKQEKELQRRVEMLEKNLKDNDVNYREYIQCKTEWENILKVKTNGIILRSKAKWVEDGERNTKYFINLEKRNYNTNYIRKLINRDNKEICNLTDIISEQKTFYKDLYSSKVGENDEYRELMKLFTSDENIPKLNEFDKILCDEEINIEECTLALKNLSNNKSPGSDGFTTNFYKFFWTDIKALLHDSFKYSYNNMTLSQNQKLSILNLLPKKDKDLRYLANWRPVSLLNTDYKILTKVLAMRLQKVIHKLINSDQVGYIKGRYIGENVRTMFDIMAYLDEIEEHVFFIQVDFEKAFDSIEWPFLIQALESYNFGAYFINWVKILYNDISSCVGNNGHYSEYFKLSRSIRQGCPISALLFILIAELIAINIRNDKNIKGIIINNIEYKLNLMADDTTLFISKIDSLTVAIQKFHIFQQCSGLKLNLNKTEIIPIGIKSGHKILLPTYLSQIKINYGPFKALGIWFAKREGQTTELNFNNRLKNMESMLTMWRSRNLSIKGKICIMKTSILSQIQFLFNMIYVPIETLKKIDKMLFNFLWNNKPAKIKRSTIIAPISEGGMGMIDVYAVHDTAKVSWIRRLYNQTDATGTSKWKNLFKMMINMNETKLNKNLEIIQSNPGKSNFHRQLLISWFKVSNTNPIQVKDICNQYILCNRFIKIDHKTISETTFGKSITSDTKLLDLLDNNNGRILQNKI